MLSVRSALFAALAVPAAAVVVTEIDYVTQYAYENYEVIVDAQGNPITTSIEIVSVGPAETSVPAATSVPAGSSHSHTAPQNYNYVTVPTTEAAAPTSSSTPPPPPPPAPTTSSSTPPPPPPPAPTTSSSTPPPPPPPAPTTSSSTPPPPPPPAPTTSSSTPPPPPPPAPTTSSSTPPPPPPPAPTTSSSTPPPPPPPAKTTSSAPPAQTTSSSSGGQFEGDATYYDVGLGACGVTNSDSDLIAALNFEQWDAFGSMSNGNPACGKTATVNYQGKSVTVTIEDKCPGCKYGDLDLSPAAFQQLADEGAGRIHVTWSFN